MLTLTRRSALFGLAAAFSLGQASLAFAQADTDKRLVVINLRGALDGMAAVVPYGDPALSSLRGNMDPKGEDKAPLDLGGFFGLHPALTNLHAMFAAGEFLPVHAVAGPYRERSHFVAQDYLESGADHRLSSGWLNRVVAAVPRTPGLPAEREGIAIGNSVPLLLRGAAPVSNWAPGGLPPPEADLFTAILALNKEDPALGPALTVGLESRGYSAGVLSGKRPDHDAGPFVNLATGAGEMLRRPDGPRIAGMEMGGWDTHSDQVKRVAIPLRQLDAGLVALKTALGPVWRQTTVLIMTEFGRTARMNGTRGTDHGTASIAFVVGGNVAGGKVRGTWPGLGSGKLFEDRDLAPTTDIRAVAKGVLAQHLGLDRRALAQIFPGSESVDSMSQIIRN